MLVGGRVGEGRRGEGRLQRFAVLVGGRVGEGWGGEGRGGYNVSPCRGSFEQRVSCRAREISEYMAVDWIACKYLEYWGDGDRERLAAGQ